jgi:hypothetical protein
MSQLSELAEEGMALSLEIAGDTFSWNGRPYAGIIDHIAHTIATSKSLFSGVYPQCGDPIRVNGKKYQITRKGNALLKAVRGGFVEDPPFVDDPGDPSLDLVFDHFVRK